VRRAPDAEWVLMYNFNRGNPDESRFVLTFLQIHATVHGIGWHTSPARPVNHYQNFPGDAAPRLDIIAAVEARADLPGATVQAHYVLTNV
jgi:hypothetical protein